LCSTSTVVVVAAATTTTVVVVVAVVVVVLSGTGELGGGSLLNLSETQQLCSASTRSGSGFVELMQLLLQLL